MLQGQRIMWTIVMRQRGRKRLASKTLPLSTPISQEMWLTQKSQEWWNGVRAFDDGAWTSDSFVSSVIIVAFSFFLFFFKGFNFMLILAPRPYLWSALTWEMLFFFPQGSVTILQDFLMGLLLKKMIRQFIDYPPWSSMLVSYLS